MVLVNSITSENIYTNKGQQRKRKGKEEKKKEEKVLNGTITNKRADLLVVSLCGDVGTM